MGGGPVLDLSCGEEEQRELWCSGDLWASDRLVEDDQ